MRQDYIAGFFALAAALSLAGSTASAAPSCTTWLKQADGTEFRTCVGDDGKQYCESTSDGGKTAVRVPCK